MIRVIIPQMIFDMEIEELRVLLRDFFKRREFKDNIPERVDELINKILSDTLNHIWIIILVQDWKFISFDFNANNILVNEDNLDRLKQFIESSFCIKGHNKPMLHTTISVVYKRNIYEIRSLDDYIMVKEVIPVLKR